MGQSLVKNYVHIVFSTKYRRKLIDDEIESELFAYLGGICNDLNCQVLNVGGYRDHVHILCMLSKNIPLAKLMEEVKGHSSKWIKTKGERFKEFYWQNGYAAFSVDERGIEIVRMYIENQKEHHSGKSKESFETELIRLLEENNIEYDLVYVLD